MFRQQLAAAVTFGAIARPAPAFPNDQRGRASILDLPREVRAPFQFLDSQYCVVGHAFQRQTNSTRN
jgi:hypothetical protein